MEIFLPIAEVTVNIITIFSLSTIVGILSGLFGVGGGFLMTPFLIFLGVPPAYAVANEANNILATSISGSTTHWLKNTLDYKMGIMIVVGGAIGTILGILTFTYFKDIGKIDIVISLAYMYILAIIGTAMLVEGVAEIDRARKKIFLKFNKKKGSPDGMTIDNKNNLWVCHYGGACITVYNSRGKKIHKIDLPAKNITNCSFGGVNNSELFITSAIKGLKKSDIKKYNLSGSLFKVKTNCKGIISKPFSMSV